jgi:4-amino-4-deoxy-L-arabinose transferase-like glycosyltransferase
MPPDYNEQVRVARYLAHGTGFVSPVGPERDDPSCWYVPGYIALIAASFRIFGEDSAASFVAVRILDLLAQAAAIALWTIVGRYLLGRRAAALAAVLMILSPTISYMEGGVWDTFPTMLGGVLCLAVFVLVCPRGVGSHVLAGGLCGLVAMVNPCFSVCYLIWLAWGLWFQRRYRRPRAHLAVQIAAALLGFLILIAPWTIRNRVVFGEWFYLRCNMGLEMWVGNAPWSDGYFLAQNRQCVHPVFQKSEEDRLVQRGEFLYFKDRMREVRHWVRTEPGRVGVLVLKRIAWFWTGHYPSGLGSSRQWIKLLGLTLPGLLAVLGLFRALIRRPHCWVLPITLLVFPVPYYLSIMLPRYRVPIEPLVLLMAAFFIVGVIDFWLRASKRTEPPRCTSG